MRPSISIEREIDPIHVQPEGNGTLMGGALNSGARVCGPGAAAAVPTPLPPALAGMQPQPLGPAASTCQAKIMDPLGRAAVPLKRQSLKDSSYTAHCRRAPVTVAATCSVEHSGAAAG